MTQAGSSTVEVLKEVNNGLKNRRGVLDNSLLNLRCSSMSTVLKNLLRHCRRTLVSSSSGCSHKFLSSSFDVALPSGDVVDGGVSPGLGRSSPVVLSVLVF